MVGNTQPIGCLLSAHIALAANPAYRNASSKEPD